MTASLADYRLDELRIGAALGEGGAAEIHRCETADGKPMVLKRYHEEALKDLDADALRHLIDWPAQLPVNDRERLMRICAWPQAAVIDDGAVIGVLMAEAPTKFFFRRNDNLVPCHFTYVAVTKERAERKNWPYYDFPHKIARFGHLLEALQFLHSYKVVLGDLQPNNILTTSPQSDATGEVTTENFLLDCDSFIVDGRAALPPMDPQNMRPPYDVDGHSATTDLYKLAKLMIRCLSEDLASDAIHYDKFSNVLPSRDFERLHKLLTLPDPGLTADDLGNLARAWQATVRPNGRLFCRTNRSLRGPWTEENRQAHLAGLEPPKVSPEPGDDSTGSTRPLALPEPRRAWNPCPYGPPSGQNGSGSKDSSDKKRLGWLVAAALVVILAAIIIVAVLANKHYSSNSSSYGTSTSTYESVTSTYYPTTASPSTQSEADQYAVVARADIGDCLHVVDGPPNGHGGYDMIEIRRVSCASSYATVRVVSITDTTNKCPGPSIYTSYRTPPIVLCVVNG